MLFNQNQNPLEFEPTGSNSLWLTLRAGFIYFAIYFATGCILGPIRILWAVPHFGVRAAELMEMPLMLVATVSAAYWTIERLSVPGCLRARLGVGLSALTFLLAAEFGLVLQMRGLSIAEYLATRDPVSGTAYYLMLCMFALMPWLMSRIGV